MKYVLLILSATIALAGNPYADVMPPGHDNHLPYCERHCGGDPSPTPEPATMGLMGIALVGGAVAYKVRRNRA